MPGQPSHLTGEIGDGETAGESVEGVEGKGQIFIREGLEVLVREEVGASIIRGILGEVLLWRGLRGLGEVEEGGVGGT